MSKIVLSIVMVLVLTSTTFAEETPKNAQVYTVYTVRSCLSSVAHFVKGTTAGVAEGAVTVVEGTFGILTAPFRVKWKKPCKRRFLYQRPTVHYKPGRLYEVHSPDLVIEFD